MFEDYQELLRKNYGIEFTLKEKSILDFPNCWNPNYDISPIGSDIGHDSFFKYLELYQKNDSDLRTVVEVFKHMDLLKFYNEYSKQNLKEKIQFLGSSKTIKHALDSDRLIISCSFAQVLLNKTLSDGLSLELERALVRQTYPEWGELFEEATQHKEKTDFYSKLLSALIFLIKEHS